MRKIIQSLLTILFLASAHYGLAQISVAPAFSDNMVLQRNKKVPVWGKAAPGEKILVQFNGQTQETVAGKDSTWKVYLQPMEANNEGKKLTVSGNSTVTFNNVVVGDVWIMAGQSNMFRNVKSMGNINKEIVEQAGNSNIRFLKVPPKIALKPQNSVEATWQVLNRKNVLSLTAIGTIIAEKIQPELDIPIGIISVNMGSTSVECWVPKEILEKEPFLETWRYWEDVINGWDHGAYERYLMLQQKQAHRKHKTPPTKETMIKVTETRTFPSGAYNAMLYPLFPYAAKGIVWRQGEANASRAVQYEELLPVMIRHWRKMFEDENMPFIQIGLPAYGKKEEKAGESTVAELRAAQQKIAQKVPACYYIPILDLNDVSNNKGNIHPHNKYLAGTRTARFILGNIEGVSEKVEIPVLKEYKIKENKVILTFDQVKDGLFTGKLNDLKGEQIVKTNETVHNFIIAGKNKHFVKAEAKITGKNKIEVWSDKIKHPAAVRYAWENLVLNINLYNGSKMPVSSFRTDNWRLSTEGNYKPKISLVRPK